MFGSPEEVAEMAKPIRTAKNRREAANVLASLVNKSPFRSKTGVTARLPAKSIGKNIERKSSA
jgi:hypothetical protein